MSWKSTAALGAAVATLGYACLQDIFPSLPSPTFGVEGKTEVHVTDAEKLRMSYASRQGYIAEESTTKDPLDVVVDHRSVSFIPSWGIGYKLSAKGYYARFTYYSDVKTYPLSQGVVDGKLTVFAPDPQPNSVSITTYGKVKNEHTVSFVPTMLDVQRANTEAMRRFCQKIQNDLVEHIDQKRADVETVIKADARRNGVTTPIQVKWHPVPNPKLPECPQEKGK